MSLVALDDDLQIRLARPPDALELARVHVQGWQDTYCGLIADDYLATMRVESKHEFWTQKLGREAAGNTFVGEYKGQILGFCSAGPTRSEELEVESEIYALYLLARAQKRGLGRALFAASLALLSKQGMRSVGLWVLHDNPAAEFYRHQGGLEGPQRTIQLAGHPYQERSFLWPHLDPGEEQA